MKNTKIREIGKNLNKYGFNKKQDNYLVDKDTLNEFHPNFKQRF